MHACMVATGQNIDLSNQVTWTPLLHRSLGRPGTAGGDGVVVVCATIRAIGPFAAVYFGEFRKGLASRQLIRPNEPKVRSANRSMIRCRFKSCCYTSIDFNRHTSLQSPYNRCCCLTIMTLQQDQA
jgi:hypothetical protein